MKTSKSIYILLFLLTLCSNTAFAQNDLTEEDKEELQERVKQKVEEFQGYLSDIVNTELSDNRRRSSIQSALALFIGKGKPYSVENDYGEKVLRKAVRMQLSSVNRKSLRWLYMTKYLNNQYNNVHNYRKVRIESADAVRVDNIYQTGDGKYQAVAYFCQKYVSYDDHDRISYGDVSRKRVIVYIDAIETPVGTVWDAKLGDIYTIETERL